MTAANAPPAPAKFDEPSPDMVSQMLGQLALDPSEAAKVAAKNAAFSNQTTLSFMYKEDEEVYQELIKVVAAVIHRSNSRPFPPSPSEFQLPLCRGNYYQRSRS